MRSFLTIIGFCFLLSCNTGYSIKGKVQRIEMGKDKYMLFMKDAAGKSYRVLVSQPFMGSAFKNVNPDDHIQVTGDTQHWQSEIHVKAKTIKVLN